MARGSATRSLSRSPGLANGARTVSRDDVTVGLVSECPLKARRPAASEAELTGASGSTALPEEQRS